MSMETGIYRAAPQWARIGVIMVVGSWYDALESTAPGDRRQLVRRNRADIAGEDVYLLALQRQQLGHHRALGRLRRAGDQLRTQHNQASRRGLAGELWLLGCWANMAGG